eukprot:scaffold221676_cov31-Tisochrysis_lutea.AAC.5
MSRETDRPSVVLVQLGAEAKRVEWHPPCGATGEPGCIASNLVGSRSRSCEETLIGLHAGELAARLFVLFE